MSPSAKVTALDVMAAAVRVDDGAGTAELMRLANERLPDLVSKGFEAGHIETAARGVLDRTGDDMWRDRAATVDELQLDVLSPEHATAIGTVVYSVAEASFWLGVVAGQKMSGGGR